MATRRDPEKGIGQKLSIYLCYLHHEIGLGIAEIYRHYLQYSKTTLYQHMKQEVWADVDESCLKNPEDQKKQLYVTVDRPSKHCKT